MRAMRFTPQSYPELCFARGGSTISGLVVVQPLFVRDAFHPTLAGDDPESRLDVLEQLLARSVLEAVAGDRQQGTPGFDAEADIHPPPAGSTIRLSWQPADIRLHVE